MVKFLKIGSILIFQKPVTLLSLFLVQENRSYLLAVNGGRGRGKLRQRGCLRAAGDGGARLGTEVMGTGSGWPLGMLRQR